MFFFRTVIALVGCVSMASALVVRTADASPTATAVSTPTPTAFPTGEFLTTKFLTVAGHTDAHATVPGHTITLVLPTCIQTEIPDKNGFVPPGTCHALYDFYPSFAAAVLFSVLFGVVMALHIAQAVKYKTTFCWVIIMACFWEFSSFVTRAISTKYQQSEGLALVTQILVLIAPLWVNAFDYMVLGRMIHYFLPSHSMFGVSGSLFGMTFVMLDVVSFVIQLVGGSLAGPTAPESEVFKGIHIYMGGIGLQQFFIFIFLGLAARLHRQLQALERNGTGKKNWRPLLFTLYASLGLITIRIFFRLIEFSGGKEADKNPLPFHEAYFYVFEAVPMVFALAAMNIVHPGFVLVGPDADMPGLKALLGGWRRTQNDGMEWDGMEGKNKAAYSRV
ncbi:RTA1 like protein-domain-containing protein [Mycena metata]|uniref:RTA1 like protein-domain-containing protein n=1 Tax=Mycena metata TaxID=1033252 RepID=A0AAD7MXP0_9AGAR|nr:RTA1 like protein-domain-containing protein [Mycena metata]